MVEVRDMVKNIVKSGKTVFFSSHLLAEVQQVCDHVTVLHQGTLRYSGTLEDISTKVHPGRRIVVEVQQPNDSILATLKALSFADVTVTGNVYTLAVNTQDDVRGQISKAVTSAGGLILSLREEGGGLEDAFLALVGKGA